LDAVNGKTDDDAARLGAVLPQRGGNPRVVSLADPQLHAAVFLEIALGLELQLNADVVWASRCRSDVNVEVFRLLLGHEQDRPTGETRFDGHSGQNSESYDADDRFHLVRPFLWWFSVPRFSG
jgi:hypothetical protein